MENVTKFFGDCHEKFLRKFSEKTPEGNFIEGYICHKPNRYLGSLLITRLNGESHEQFVQSMPKIHYFEDERDVCLYDVAMDTHNTAVACEKLDGSCLILYPILDDNGHIVEVVPKTRGRAVADKHFLELYKKVDKASIYDYYRVNKGILFFEMYGILNQHEIIHYDTGIDIRLIGGYLEGKFFTNHILSNLEFTYFFKRPRTLFEIDLFGKNYCIQMPYSKYRYYWEDVPSDELEQPTIIDAIDKIQSLLEYLNKVYLEWYGRIAVEGVVLNCKDSKGNQRYVKIKPRDIENKHRSQGGIPRSAITKEVLKYFDEYGSEVKEIYLEDENHHTEYLHRMLSEDYPEEFVKNSSKSIEKVFMQIWNAKQVPESIHNICEELIDEYGDKGITHCMRMFAQKYPMKKRDARTVYSVLSTLFNKRGLDL